MKSYQLIHELIQLTEELDARNNSQEITLSEFAGFLNSKLSQPPKTNKKAIVPFGKEENRTTVIASQTENNIGRLITFLSRYAKIYVKKALEDTPLQTVEEFSCLAILSTHDHLSKFELIGLNVQEKSSGVQVIQRLINAELARQWNDPDDKRGKRIAITEKGRKLCYAIFKDMTHVGKLVTGALTDPEKLTLLYLLQKLEHYHREHYLNKLVNSKNDLAIQAAKIPHKEN